MRFYWFLDKIKEFHGIKKYTKRAAKKVTRITLLAALSLRILKILSEKLSS
jgi:hypothetical protein